MLTVSTNLNEVQKRIQKIAKKTKYAESEGLNQAAKVAAKAQQVRARARFDRPTPFLLRGIYNSKSKLGFVGMASRFSTLEVQLIPGGPRGNFREAGRRINQVLLRQTEGGTVRPAGRALVVPVRPQVKNRYGNLPRGKVKKLLARPNVFQGGGREGLPPGIYERTAAGNLRMLVAYERTAKYQGGFDYYGIGIKAFRRVVRAKIDKAFAQELERL